MASPAIADAFRLLQSGDAAAALRLAQRIARAEPANARAHMAAGVALRVLGKPEESREALTRALRLDAHDYAVRYEMGATLELLEPDAALAHFEDAARLRPNFVAAHRAIAATHMARGDFERAALAYETALANAPRDPELSQLLAQAQLLLGRLDAGWGRYAQRPQRASYEAQFAQQGARYRVPTLAEAAGRAVTVIGEQGLGDVLFFLRFAPPLRRAAAKLSFVGDERLHSLLGRSGLFDALHSDRAAHALGDALPVLAGDLPVVAGGEAERYAPALRIPPDAARVSAWRKRLEEAGPRPWIGVMWRSGMPGADLVRGLSKQAPVKPLFEALSRLDGTVVSLQRDVAAAELQAAATALGRGVHDFSDANRDLEDALALVSLLDRHVGVSNTNMHLATAVGKTADVLVPFPPEWRWGAAGDASPWFPGFGVFRQGAGGDWREALAALAR